MKFAVLISTIVACTAGAVAAQTAPAAAPVAAATAPAAKFNLDTPIEDLVANPAAKVVIDKYFPGMATNANFDMFKSMSLSTLSQMSDKITPDKLAQVKTELALIK